MKVGEAPEDENTSPEAIRIQLRRSLVRMRTDYVDVYYLHRYDPDTEPHAVALSLIHIFVRGRFSLYYI